MSKKSNGWCLRKHHIYTNYTIALFLYQRVEVISVERKVEVQLKKLVVERNISLRELARLSDIEPSIINKLANNKHERIYLPHIERIAESLDIDDIGLILKIVPKTDNI